MLENKHINKIVIVLTILAVLSVYTLMFTMDSSASDAGYAMEYETALFDTSQIMDVQIEIDESQWNDLLENAINEEYYPCNITINHETYTNVGIRAKGNTSLSMVYSSDSDRYSLKVSFDEYVDGQNCHGLTELVLNNNYSDATMMREAICYDMFQFLNTDSSLYNYAKITVNGEYTGLYLALEPVDKSFALRNYGLGYGELYKPDSMNMGGAGKMKDFDVNDIKEELGLNNVTSHTNVSSQSDVLPEGNFQPDQRQENFGGQRPSDFSAQKPSDFSAQKPSDFGERNSEGKGDSSASLNYIDDNLDSYTTIWDGSVFNTGNKDRQRVVTALKNISSEDADSSTLEKYMDVDNLLRYMAVHTFVVNLDSLSSNMSHNYYLYEEHGQLNLIPWDYNLAFGGFQSGSASEAVNFPIDTPFSSSIDIEERQFFMALLENEEYLEQYHEYLSQLADEYVGGGRLAALYDHVRSQIDELIKDDPTSFFTYEEYDQGAKLLLKVIALRAESVKGQLDGTIPSTNDEQSMDSSALVATDGIDLSVMGSMGGDKGGGKGGDRDRRNGSAGGEDNPRDAGGFRQQGMN